MPIGTPEPLALDLHGKISNTTVSNGLMAVFEAVANAIQATDEAGDSVPGRIDVTILRERPIEDGSPPGRVTGFVITDHGAGFTDDNYASFKRSDSTRKRSLGGKGLGRFTWLRVFRSVRVDSAYDEPDGERRLRSFTFGLDGITPVEPKPLDHRGSVITLTSPDPAYAESLQSTAERLAQVLVEHCLLALLDEKSPPIYILDPGQDGIPLKQFLKEHFLTDRRVSEYTIEGVRFRQVHLLLHARKNAAHLIHLCAAKRSVKQKRLSTMIPELTGPLQTSPDGRAVVYAGYVVSDLLDRRVLPDRDEFFLNQTFVDEDTDSPRLVMISEGDIETHAVTCAAEFLSPLLGPFRDSRRAEIKKFVEEEAPQFRYLLKTQADRAIAIKAGAKPFEIYQHLSRIEFEHDKEVESRVGDTLATIDSTKTAAQHSDELERLLAEVSEGAQAKLAKYVLYRRQVISILEKHLSLGTDGHFALEKAVHQTVFPMSRTSDDVPGGLWNLWLVDERLAFHRFLASDVRLDQIKEIVKVNEVDRPDLAIFKRPMGFVEAGDAPFGAVILVDFKRPGRKGYDTGEKHEDPVLQVTDYIQKILKGAALKPNGAPMVIPKGTPFYAYVIADLQPSLVKLLEGRGFMETPDKGGYFWYNTVLCAYIEVMTYERLVLDAKRRNRAFFNALRVTDI